METMNVNARIIGVMRRDDGQFAVLIAQNEFISALRSGVNPKAVPKPREIDLLDPVRVDHEIFGVSVHEAGYFAAINVGDYQLWVRTGDIDESILTLLMSAVEKRGTYLTGTLEYNDSIRAYQVTSDCVLVKDH